MAVQGNPQATFSPEDLVQKKRPRGEIRYGDDRTIHRTGYADVEVGRNGKVVAVWFRCMMLPFQAHYVGVQRTKEMRRAYKEGNQQDNGMSLKAVVMEYEPSET